jgi:hypothetical protein
MDGEGTTVVRALRKLAAGVVVILVRITHAILPWNA